MAVYLKRCALHCPQELLTMNRELIEQVSEAEGLALQVGELLRKDPESNGSAKRVLYGVPMGQGQ